MLCCHTIKLFLDLVFVIIFLRKSKKGTEEGKNCLSQTQHDTRDQKKCKLKDIFDRVASFVKKAKKAK